MRVAILPIEKGDTRDALKRLGEQVVRDAITNAKPIFEIVGDGTVQAARKEVNISSSVATWRILESITFVLKKTNRYFTRANQLVLIRDGNISPILEVGQLIGTLSVHCEFVSIKDDKKSFKTLPNNYAIAWLNNYEQLQSIPAISVFSSCPVYRMDWELAKSGYNAEDGIYYAGEEVHPRDDMCHLEELLEEFCFKGISDRTNYIGMLLTCLLMPRFMGNNKPALLLNGNQPQLGKSSLAQILAVVRDGKPCETCSYNSNDEEFEKRLGATIHSGT